MSLKINGIVGAIKNTLKTKLKKPAVDMINLSTFNKIEGHHTSPSDMEVLLGKLPTLDNFEKVPKFMFYR